MGGARKGAGRKPKPTDLKVMQGTFRKDRAVPGEPAPVPGEIEAPWETNPVVLEWFERLKGYLKSEQRGSKSDALALWLTARRCVEVVGLNEVVEQEGQFYMGGLTRELIKAHPAVKMRNDALRHLQTMLSELGLTPASRTRVSMTIKPAKNKGPWDDFAAEG